MAYDLYRAGELIGSIVRRAGGVAYAYLPNGAALGTFADLGSAAAALAARVGPEPLAA